MTSSHLALLLRSALSVHKFHEPQNFWYRLEPSLLQVHHFFSLRKHRNRRHDNDARRVFNFVNCVGFQGFHFKPILESKSRPKRGRRRFSRGRGCFCGLLNLKLVYRVCVQCVVPRARGKRGAKNTP